MEFEKFIAKVITPLITDPSNAEQPMLLHREIELIKDVLLKCDGFEDVTEIVTLKLPNYSDCGSTSTLLYNPDAKFSGKMFIYSIFLTPAMYDPNKIHVPIKDGIVITPTLFNSEDLIPEKTITIKFNPGENELGDLFNKILENHDDYVMKPMYKVMIRGIFESISTNGKTVVEDITKIENKLKVLADENNLGI